MRGGALPPALLCAALGFALGFAPAKIRPYGVAVLILAALAASFVKTPLAWQDGVFLGCWASVALAAASVHLPKGMGPRLALALSLNCGIWVGAVIATAGKQTDLIKALPCVLVCIPAAWAVGKGWGVAAKVMASWLIAVSILAASLPLVPTPGYKPDHME